MSPPHGVDKGLIVGFGAAVTSEIKPLIQILFMLIIVILTARLSFSLYGKVGATIMTILSIIPILKIFIINLFKYKHKGKSGLTVLRKNTRSIIRE